MARRQPRSIQQADAIIAAQDALEKQEAAAQPQQPAVTAETPAPDGNAAPVEPVQPVQPIEQPADADALEKETKEIADLTAQIKVLTEDMKTAAEQRDYFKQRWDTLAGIHKKQVTEVQQQNSELKARVSELEQAVKNGPQTDEDLDAVKKALGDKADDYTDEGLEEMARNRRMAREAAEASFGKEVKALRQELASLKSTGANAKSTGFWERVEQARPGFTSARDDFQSGYEIWMGSENPHSADGLTRQQCVDMYAKLGNMDAIVGMLDEFARITGYRFGNAKASEKSVTPPPEATKPQSVGHTTPANATSTQTQTAAPKSRFPEAFAHEMANKWARMSSSSAFTPFTIKAGGKTVTFQTRAQAHKMALECESAIEENRVYS